MANISDLIESFILETIGEDDLIELSRNSLASYFSCAPSQINYVLATRFTPDRGYATESKRGGGGSITVIRLREDKVEALAAIVAELEETAQLTVNKASSILKRLVRDGVLEEGEANLIRAALSDKALCVPVNITGALRKQIFKEILTELMKRRE